MDMPLPDQRILSGRDGLIARFRGVLPTDAEIADPAETRAYECDALSAYRCAPLAVVLPRSTAEVSAVLRLCSQMGVKVVPRGAGGGCAVYVPHRRHPGGRDQPLERLAQPAEGDDEAEDERVGFEHGLSRAAPVVAGADTRAFHFLRESEGIPDLCGM